MRPIVLLIALAALPVAAQPAAPAGFEPLFNGVDLTGWRGRPHLNPAQEASWSFAERARKQIQWDEQTRRHWRVESGEIVNDGKGPYLTTLEEFGDAEYRLEYRTVAGADSGIYLRATPQVQIWDTTEAGGKWKLGADKGSGGLWNNSRFARFPLVHADRPFGEWNSLRIVQVGARTSVWLNGRLVVDHVPMENYWDRAAPLRRRGPLQLQTHGGEIRFRRLHVKRLDADAARRWLAERCRGNFESLFDGRSLAGWTGAVKDYEVKEGAIACKSGRGGVLHSEDRYGDFRVRFEFLLPPGGNNGLAIRYPGRGSPAYDGLCELQVLDNRARKYEDLKPWQYHGSAYGLFPAHRGYLRAPGEWNFQVVTVRGYHVTVELNGTLILEADLDAKQAPADGREHRGLALREGFFGFCGHNDPVRFRALAIERL